MSPKKRNTFQSRLCKHRMEFYMPLMKCNSPCPVYRVLTDSIKPESQRTPITQYRNSCVIKSIIIGLHLMIILQNKFHLFSKPKTLWMLHLNDHLYSKSCLFVGSEILGSHRGLRKPSYTFTGFHCWTHMYNQN